MLYQRLNALTACAAGAVAGAVIGAGVALQHPPLLAAGFLALLALLMLLQITLQFHKLGAGDPLQTT